MTSRLIPIALAVVVVMAFRVRRTMSEQVYRSATIWSRVVLLSLLGLFVLVVEMHSVTSLAGVAAGLILGLVLGGYSLRHTAFQKSVDPPRYKTNPYIGAVVVTLFAVRILYDAMLAHAHISHPGPVNPFAASWLAALLYFLFVAYWDVYYIGLIRLLGQPRRPHQPG